MVSMETGVKAGPKIIKSVKCDKRLILSIFLKDFINFGRVFRDFYWSFYITCIYKAKSIPTLPP